MREKIVRFRNYSGIIMMLICTVVLIKCGGGGAPAPPPISGKVVQGAVSGAIVFADHRTGPEANYKMDADEADTATTTASDGRFTAIACKYLEVVDESGLMPRSSPS